MWIQAINPLHNTLLSALAAALPIAFLFVALISKKISGHVASVLTLALSLAVAGGVFHMPLRLAALSALYGIANGLFPIAWIVIAAIYLYNLSVASGGFAIVRKSIESITEDRRLQALLIAFCFGAFLEGCAGFGAPVAITAGMLIGLGFQPFYAATVCLIANTAPVAFGGIGIAILTAGQVSGIDPSVIAAMVSHQLPFLAFLIPFWLIMVIAGWKGTKGVWPALLITAASYSLTMYLVASQVGPYLPDIIASLVSLMALVLFLRFWKPAAIWRFPHEQPAGSGPSPAVSASGLVRAWMPYGVLIVLVAVWGIAPAKAILNRFTFTFAFPGLHNAILSGTAPVPAAYSFAWLSAAGTAIFISAILTAWFSKLSFRQCVTIGTGTLVELKRPIITIGSIVGFAYVANLSGMTASIGTLLTLAGGAFPLVSPLIGWLGVFITGSDTSSNALFSAMQRSTAASLGLNPVLTVTANTTGGVTAKMVSPQSIAVATASVKLPGEDGRLFRATVLHSLALVAAVCLLTYLQAYFLTGMVPRL